MNESTEFFNDFSESVFSKTNNRLSGEENYSCDPFIILTIISVLIQLAQFIYECRKKPEQLLDISKRRPIIETVWLRQKIKQLLPNNVNKRLHIELADSILDNIETLSSDDIEILLKEGCVKYGTTIQSSGNEENSSGTT